MQNTLNESTPEAQATLPAKHRGKGVALAVVLAVAALCGAGLWWWHAGGYETTDDAFISGHVTTVSPQVAGRVVKVLVNDNRKVQAGDVLIRLDPEPFKVKVDQAAADLSESVRKLQEAKSQHLSSVATVEQAQADVVSAQAQAGNSATDLTRYDRLVVSGSVAQQARDNAATLARTSGAALQSARKRQAAAEAQAAQAATHIQTAEAEVDKCRATLEQVRLDLSYTEIKALVSGRVTNRSVEPGDYLQTGQPVLSLVQDDIWVVANFKETQLTRMRPGQTVTVTVDTYPGLLLKGHVDSLQDGTGTAFSLLPAENATGNYVKVVQRLPVKIVFESLPDGYHLAPGMSVIPEVRVGEAVSRTNIHWKPLASLAE
jgi:membrane fusion protein (multidrug efflux system)